MAVILVSCHGFCRFFQGDRDSSVGTLLHSAVNVASRMESNSKSCRIHCSKESAKLLLEQAPEIPLYKRGTINIKGKGHMKTYWVGTKPVEQSLSHSTLKDVSADSIVRRNDKEEEIKFSQDMSITPFDKLPERSVVECHPKATEPLHARRCSTGDL